MKLPLLVCAKPDSNLNNRTRITAGRWRVEFEGLSYSTFKILLNSPAYPEGFELDFHSKPIEFYVNQPTWVELSIIHVGEEKEITAFLRSLSDGLQYHTNEVRATGTSG